MTKTTMIEVVIQSKHVRGQSLPGDQATPRHPRRSRGGPCLPPSAAASPPAPSSAGSRTLPLSIPECVIVWEI